MDYGIREASWFSSEQSRTKRPTQQRHESIYEARFVRVTSTPQCVVCWVCGIAVLQLLNSYWWGLWLVVALIGAKIVKVMAAVIFCSGIETSEAGALLEEKAMPASGPCQIDG